MITLCQFQPAFGLPNASPFCMKVETYLRMAALPYELAKKVDLRKAPKGKLPYIVDNGKTISDSGFILDYLKETYGDKLDQHLTKEERANALAYRRLLEESLYWAMVHARWIDSTGWEITRQVFFGNLPLPLRATVPNLIRKKVRNQLHQQGIGRHNAEEINKLATDDLTAASVFLAEKPYFLGDQPTSLDATAYGFIANVLYHPVDIAIKRHAQALPNLIHFCERMKQRYFGEDRRQKNQDRSVRLPEAVL